MEPTRIFTEDDAVSPVIGVILMVAITVILAAVIGAFVLNIGSEQAAPPQNQFTWTFSDAGENVTVEHGGGSQLDATLLSLTGPWESGSDCAVVDSREVTSGDYIVNNTTSADECRHTASDGDTLGIVWTSSSEQQSQIISEKPVP